jgi:radical SAM enzyme (TIGR01210 family)
MFSTLGTLNSRENRPEVFFRKRSDINAVEIFLKGNGCRYGKCTFCSFPKETYKENFSSEDWLKVIKALIPKFAEKEKGTEEIFIYAYGNVLDEKNLPKEVLFELLNLLKNNFPNLRLVSLENRVEEKFGFRKEKILKIKNFLEPIELEIAIGYETSNWEIRELLLKKGLDEEKFVGALKVLSEIGCKVRVYLLYPASPFLTESRAFRQLTEDMERLIELKEKFSLIMRVHICKLELKKGTPLGNIFKNEPKVNFERVKRELPHLYREMPIIFSLHPD